VTKPSAARFWKLTITHELAFVLDCVEIRSGFAGFDGKRREASFQENTFIH
jgi:hypothetical protein